MSGEFDIRISCDVRIEKRTPYKNTAEAVKIKQAEIYLQANVQKLIYALEEKLNSELDPNEPTSYGIKHIELTPRSPHGKG